MTKTNAILTITLAGLAAGGVWACSRTGSAEGPKEAPPVVVGPENIVVAANDTIRTGPSVSGALDAERTATIKAELGATVTDVYVEAGTPVRQGQLLLRLDQTGIRDQYLSAQSSLQAAQASSELAKSDLSRDQRLADAGALAQRQLEATRRASLQADAAYAEARSRFATAQLNLHRTEIRAPFNGVVATRPVRAGDVVASGNILVSVVDPSSLRLEAQVPVDQLSAIRVGTPVLFTVSGYEGRQFRGVISRVSPAVDPTTRQVPIVVRLPNTEGRLVSGVFVDGRVATTSRAGVTVPTAAVDQRGLRPLVYRIKGGALERVEVVLGFEDPVTEMIEVRSGIAGGDTLVVGSAQGLPVGTHLRVTLPAETASTASTHTSTAAATTVRPAETTGPRR